MNGNKFSRADMLRVKSKWKSGRTKIRKEESNHEGKEAEIDWSHMY